MATRKQRTSREYVHHKCKTVTVIEGPEFAALADPLANMTGTYCAECDDAFPITEFAWADTGERISDTTNAIDNRPRPLSGCWRLVRGCSSWRRQRGC